MNGKKKNIRQKLNDSYPEPTLSADSAWKTMENFLAQDMPAAPTKFLGATTGALMKGFSALLFCFGVIYIVVDMNRDQQGKKTAPKTPSSLKQPAYPQNEIQRAKKAGHSPNNEQGAENKLITKNEYDKDKLALVPFDTLNSSASIETGSSTIRKYIKRNKPKSGRSDKNSLDIAQGRIRPLDIKNSSAIHRSAVSHIRPNNNLRGDEKRSITFPNENSIEGSFVTSADRIPNLNKIPQRIKRSAETQNPIGLEKDDNMYSTGTFSRMTTISYPLSKGSKFNEFNTLRSRLLSQPVNTGEALSETIKESPKESFFKTVYAGLTWSPNLPFSGYDVYLKGAKNGSRSYDLLIPGLWIGKKMNTKNMIVMTFQPSSQFFGGKKQLISKLMPLDSSRSYIESYSLAKTMGFNAGLQINHQINSRWSVETGLDFYKQKKGLIRYQAVSTNPLGIIDYVPLTVVTQKTDSLNILSSYFTAINVKAFYKWHKVYLGVGASLPLNNLTDVPGKKLKPLNAQIFLRWQIK